jgi:outer membrane protein OmpA-like peptidoglycan-associated protein
VFAVPALAQAQPVTGFYVGGGVGINDLLSSKIKSGGTGSLTSSIGPAGVISGGYGYGNGLRVELQGDYRYESAKGPGKSGNITQYGGFLNALYDFDIGGPVYPYVGLGVGYEAARLSGGLSGSGNGGVAGQGIVGLSYPIADVPGLSLTADVRYESGFANEKFKNGGVTTTTAPLSNVSALLGLRYAFGVAPAPKPAPAPAPMATPAPAPARTYIVFFDWDKADLTARAKSIIAEAADASKKVATTTIDVSGHADKTGTAAYNKALSLKRAQAVGAELVAKGVPAKEIVITAYGDTKPLVPTAAGVREPQNRRVEIVLK